MLVFFIQTDSCFTWRNHQSLDWWNFRVTLLLIQDDVWEPDIFWRNSDGGDSSVFIWIPSQLVINPFLVKGKHRKPHQQTDKQYYNTMICLYLLELNLMKLIKKPNTSKLLSQLLIHTAYLSKSGVYILVLKYITFKKSVSFYSANHVLFVNASWKINWLTFMRKRL